jgi:glucan biosynthesis protein C
MKARLWYIDSLRACLMIGGVFFHAALVYGVYTAWLVRDPSAYRAFDALALVLSSFRMPAFFVLAGFFCTYLMMRRPVHQVLLDRVLLVTLPFLALALTAQPLQYAIKLAYGHELAAAGWAGFLHRYLSPNALVKHPFIGHAFVGHLWFLADLLVFYVLAALVLMQPRLRRWGAQALSSPLTQLLLQRKVLWAGLSAAAVLMLEALLRWAGVNPDFGLQDLLRYLPYFVVGAVAFSRAELLEAFLSTGPLELCVLPVAFLVEVFERHVGFLHEALGLLCQLFVAVMLSVLLLRLFRRFFNRRWALQQVLVDASFSVYLFHHVCVAAAAALLVPVHGLHPFAKYALVVAAGVGLPLALHMGLIARHPWLRLVFNGRLRPASDLPRPEGAPQRGPATAIPIPPA